MLTTSFDFVSAISTVKNDIQRVSKLLTKKTIIRDSVYSVRLSETRDARIESGDHVIFIEKWNVSPFR